MGLRIAACLLATCIGACASAAPPPPSVPGAEWGHTFLYLNRSVRSEHIEGTLRTSNSTFGFELRFASSSHRLECSDEPAPGVVRCTLDGQAFATLGDGCMQGHLLHDGHRYEIRPWFADEDHVGFVVHQDGQPAFAYDLDRTWEDRMHYRLDTSEAMQMHAEALGFMLQVVWRADERGRPPFRCPELLGQRRYPR
ncbi:MAG: hypothetical protein AAF938_08620 [Myxococcota bacterium]